MNIHNRFRNIYFARVSIHGYSALKPSLNTPQSGQSLIEHSYRADSDLSPSGWAYAEKLKDFVTKKYTKSLSERGIDGKGRRLVVSRAVGQTSCLQITPLLDLDFGSNAMQPYCLAIFDWIGSAIECQGYRKTADVRDKPRCLGWTHAGAGDNFVGYIHLGLIQGLGQEVLS